MRAALTRCSRGPTPVGSAELPIGASASGRQDNPKADRRRVVCSRSDAKAVDLRNSFRWVRRSLGALFAACVLALAALALTRVGPSGECGSIASPRSPGNDDYVGCASFRSSRAVMFVGVSVVAAATVIAITYLEAHHSSKSERDREWRRKLEV